MKSSLEKKSEEIQAHNRNTLIERVEEGDDMVNTGYLGAYTPYFDTNTLETNSTPSQTRARH